MNSEAPASTDDEIANSNVVSFSAAKMKGTVFPDSEEPSMFHDTGMPTGYVADSNGMYFLEPDEFGDVSPVRICSPITVVGRCRRENGTGWGLLVEVVDPDGRTHKVILEQTSLHGTPAALLRPLVDLGLQIEKTGTALKRVAHLLGASKPRPVIVRSTRTGWLDSDFSAFILADGSLIGDKSRDPRARCWCDWRVGIG